MAKGREHSGIKQSHDSGVVLVQEFGTWFLFVFFPRGADRGNGKTFFVVLVNLVLSCSPSTTWMLSSCSWAIPEHSGYS